MTHVCAGVRLELADILEALRALDYPAVDGVVGVRRGGAFVAGLVAAHLGVPLGFVTAQFRNDDHSPRFDSPRIDDFGSTPDGDHLLVVDDVAVTGATLTAVCEGLEARTTTLVIRGDADLVAYPDLTDCIHWPW